ncbi:hypothetical protein FB451DRAFT_1375405 [Mycena latifolia]|nr:hypothetical protein FB451DRAFT_1375405 [Mycena latifolia]
MGGEVESDSRGYDFRIIASRAGSECERIYFLGSTSASRVAPEFFYVIGMLWRFLVPGRGSLHVATLVDGARFVSEVLADRMKTEGSDPSWRGYEYNGRWIETDGMMITVNRSVKCPVDNNLQSSPTYIGKSFSLVGNNFQSRPRPIETVAGYLQDHSGSPENTESKIKLWEIEVLVVTVAPLSLAPACLQPPSLRLPPSLPAFSPEIYGTNVKDYGGGAGALSELIMLDRLMYQIGTQLGLQVPPHPCDYFELIGGSGTGGIIALMLGRWCMSIADAILAFEKLKPQAKRGVGEAFRASKFEEVLKDIFNTEKIHDPNPNHCKTFVCAMNKMNMNAVMPELFRSYNTPNEPASDCMIWEAARATSATPGLFKPMEIRSRRMKQQYIGGSLGHNNPTALVLAEAECIYPSRPVVLVVSIGSGHPNTIQILKSPTASTVAKAMKRIATDSEKMHQDTERRYQGISNTYFRFNVQQGMQALEPEHWGKLDQVTAHTEAYLRMEEVKPKLTGTVGILLNPVIHSSHSLGYLKVCPPPTFHFTGREDILGAMKKYFNMDVGRRHILLLHGLGGAGKSQIAFKFVEQSSHPDPRFSEVYFIDSSSQKTIESDLSSIAHHIEWLMVFNNADDAQLKLSQYFPSCSHGNIIITSRNQTLNQAVEAKLKVEQMELKEAIDLLLAAARYDIHEAEYRAIGQQIVQKLHSLPLAVAQAGAFISVSCPLQKYLDLHKSAAQRIRLLNQLPSQSDYELSVYATWHISFEKVSIQARQLLQLCSFIHHDGITETIFENAALYQFTTEDVDIQESLKFLAGLKTPTLKWDSLKFLAVTTELGNYSLIDFQAGGRALTLSIHPLVHEWCRTTVNSDSSTELCMHKLVGMAISARHDALFNHQIFPHLDVLLFKATEGSGRQPNIRDISFAAQCLRVYYEEGKWDDGVDLANSMLPIASVGANTLSIEGALANIYAGKGDFHRARVLAESVLERKKTLLGEDDLDISGSMASLAIIYKDLGQFKKAEELHTMALNKYRTLLGDAHPYTLIAMGNLATTYCKLGQFKEAEELQTMVLDKHRTLLGNDHPETLTSMANLAMTYRDLGQSKKAEELETMVLDKRRTLLGEDHPDTLIAMGNLAMTYRELGEFKKAEELETMVLDKHRTLLGEDHPDTLSAMANLAATYKKLGEFKNAEELETNVLNKSKTVLGEDHPDTLSSMASLATTYLKLGQLKQAEDLQTTVLNKRRAVLGKDHPKTLSGMASLAVIYCEMGRLSDARGLQEQALRTYRQTLGEFHPDTQRITRELATTVGRLERVESV